ncbi:rhamnosyltransferase [Tardiphaga sp. OK246]|uniref:glycosyltransferase family A protein n=1 Tax=Tardiphaga sp. OK246 TaxID=1855307 RepID=UPI000B65B3DE|nr:glycosyltransferase family 2 protein [Tardiphaga sp. OK246]SNT63984.1 rhamnosyltransferase [Tardiphaga sp. OK246]
MKASVIIPTKNAGPGFAGVLQAVLTQQCPWPYEVIVIDSGSTDGTLDLCRESHVRLLQIEPASFGHGRTRNLAIEHACGEFVALLTHDALPASRHWLARLVDATDAEPDIAGTFGRHLAYPSADPYTQRDLDWHFDNFAAMPKVVRLDDRSRYEVDVAYRQMLHFFSDNNACVRRNVWERYPYPDVSFAEDQIWAQTVIEAGYAKAYADDAAVFHSHQYSVQEIGRRSFDESAAFARLFGYNLCPTIATAVLRTVHATARDLMWSIQRKEVIPHLYWMARSPFANFARQLGHYSGAHERNIPASVIDRVSLDGALKSGKSFRRTK